MEPGTFIMNTLPEQNLAYNFDAKDKPYLALAYPTEFLVENHVELN